jgi:hypothetical protein
MLIVAVLFVGLYFLIGQPIPLLIAFTVLEIAYPLTISKVVPKSPRTYCPDPLDGKFLPG